MKARAGRKPKPTKLKLLDGETHQDRINRNEPQPLTNGTTCPKHLTPAAKQEWKRIYPELRRMGLISKVDRVALAAYCEAYALWVEYKQIVADKGALYKTALGNVITSPALSVMNKALEQMHKYLTEFGMTPASRSRISVEITDSDDPLDRLLNTKAKRN